MSISIIILVIHLFRPYEAPASTWSYLVINEVLHGLLPEYVFGACMGGPAKEDLWPLPEDLPTPAGLALMKGVH